MKDSPSAILALFDAYRSLDPRDTDAVDAVIAAAVESHDETERFDAMALVREFKIVAAIPGLQRLASRLRATASPGAPFERAKAMEILGELADVWIESRLGLEPVSMSSVRRNAGDRAVVPVNPELDVDPAYLVGGAHT